MLKPGDITICTVKGIDGATVSLETESGIKATMIMSEVAAGRIRNLREYIAPNKKIVCKVLVAEKDNVQLSLRRVTGKEREQALENYKKERTLISILKNISQNPEEIVGKIKLDYTATEFFEEIKKDKSILNDFFNKKETEKLLPLLEEKQEKEKEVKSVFMVKTLSESGIEDLKSILSQNTSKNIKINYLGSSKFSISVKAQNFKNANSILQEALEKIEKEAKSRKAIFEIK